MRITIRWELCPAVWSVGVFKWILKWFHLFDFSPLCVFKSDQMGDESYVWLCCDQFFENYYYPCDRCSLLIRCVMRVMSDCDQWAVHAAVLWSTRLWPDSHRLWGNKYVYTRSLGSGSWFSLTSFSPFGCSGRVTHTPHEGASNAHAI